MRADAEIFKDKIEVSLDGRQVFYLFFGGAVIASLVFVLGVMVGKRVEARTTSGSVALASAADDPLTALDRLGQGESESRSFRSALIDGDENPRYAVDIALAAGAEKAKEKAKAKAKEEAEAKAEAKEERSAGKSAAEPQAAKASQPDEARPEEKSASKEPDKAAEPEEKPTVAAAAPAEEHEANDPRSQDSNVGEPANDGADGADGADDADDGADADRSEEDADAPAKFTLQLSSFRDRVEADSFFDKLKAAGYQPYIVEADVPDKGLWYRVRLGGYASYDAALVAKKEFEDSQHIIAYVTRIR